MGRNMEKKTQFFFALFSKFFIFCAAFEGEKVGDRLGYRGEIILMLMYHGFTYQEQVDCQQNMGIWWYTESCTMGILLQTTKNES